MGVQIFIYNRGNELIASNKIMQVLKEVVDPEIVLNVVDLNLIKKITIVVLDEPWMPPKRIGE